MMAASSRVEEFLGEYAALSDPQQQMVRDMVELAWFRVSRHQLLAERLAASVPFEVTAGRHW
jgi:hypothetical protein